MMQTSATRNSVQDEETAVCKRKRESLSPLRGAQASSNAAMLEESHCFAQNSQCSEPLFVEIFAGSAKLSGVAKAKGMRTLAVDHSFNKHKPQHAIFCLDLTRPECQEQLMNSLNSDIPRALHLAPPCETCSKSRERPLPELGDDAPQPLRNADFPFGFDTLQGRDRDRVLNSNILYVFSVELLFFCFLHHVVVSLENPDNSLLWIILAALVRKSTNQAFRKWFQQLAGVVFSNCAWGGQRPTLTRWLSTPSVYAALEAPCPLDHQHRPYRGPNAFRFVFAAEAEYPEILCNQVIDLLSDHLQWRTQLPRAFLTAAAHKQHRKHRPLVPEFQTFVTAPEPPLRPHKLLDMRSEDGVNNGSGEIAKMRFGVYHTKEEFVRLACLAKHPFDTAFTLDDLTRQNLFNLLTKGPIQVCKDRIQQLIDVQNMATALEAEEKILHDSMPHHIQQVVRGKRVLLWQRLLEKFNYPDMEVVKFMKTGVELVGQPDHSPLFQKCLVPAATSPELLKKSAVWRNEMFLERPVHAEEPNLTKTLWELTLQEVKRGFLVGPFADKREVASLVGAEDFVISRRFVLLQGEAEKPRAIDDCRSSGVNSAFTQVDKLQLQDLDFFTGMAALAASCVSSRKVSIACKSGETLEGTLHPDFGQTLDWAGKCLDLEKAYRQVPVATSSLAFSVVLVHNEEGVAHYFISYSLPFGACSSVYAFNRISLSIRFIIQHVLGGVLSCFYDDFPILEPRASCVLMNKAVGRLLQLLGWKYSQGDKDFPFAGSFNVLGATVSLAGLGHGRLVVANKEGRLERIAEFLDKYPPSKNNLQVVAGLLQYAVGQCLGSSLKLAARAFSSLTSEKFRLSKPDFLHLCSWVKCLLMKVRPRELRFDQCKSPIVVFTDASWDGATARWGVVIIDRETALRKVFAGEVPATLVQHWRTTVGSQIICQAEMYAVLLARFHIHELFSSRRVIIWVDNEACRFALIKSVSPSVSLLAMVQIFHSLGEDDGLTCWIERVPSEANVADLPSRGEGRQASDLLGADFSTELHLPAHILKELMEYHFLSPCLPFFRDSKLCSANDFP